MYLLGVHRLINKILKKEAKSMAKKKPFAGKSGHGKHKKAPKPTKVVNQASPKAIPTAPKAENSIIGK